MVDKKACQQLYRELKNDINDLESSSFRGLWFSRIEQLKDAGCFWHFMVLKRKARDYEKGKGDNPSSYHSLWRDNFSDK